MVEKAEYSEVPPNLRLKNDNFAVALRKTDIFAKPKSETRACETPLGQGIKTKAYGLPINAIQSHP